MTAVIIAIICIILIVLDILGHRKFRVRRKRADWIFLCIFIAGAVISMLFAARQWMPGDDGSSTGRYLAYRYLMDGDADGARAVTIRNETLTETQKEFLEMLACGIEGDYRRMYFSADAFLSDPSKMPEQEDVAEKLYTISMNAVADGSNRRSAIDECIRESYAAAGITETVELQEYYTIDKKIRSADTEGIQASRIKALVKSFPGETGVKKLAISYFVLTGDFDNAIETAGELLDDDRSAASMVVYTDIYAQRAFLMTEEQIRASEDKEIVSLVKKSDAAAQKAAGYDEDNENAARQNEAALQYLESASDVFYQRILNYINVKIPVTGDKTGLLSLQQIKMQVLKGERGAAKEAFAELMENADSLSEASPVRSALIQMAADLKQYLVNGEEEDKAAVFSDCTDLFQSQSQDVIQSEERTINEEAAGQLASMMLYDRALFEITNVDTSGYPKVSVTLNTNIQKDNIFGGAGEFYKDDFRVKENDTSVTDFSLTADIGTGDRSLVLACDTVGVTEDLQEQLRSAFLLAEDLKAARRLALIGANAETLSSFEDSEARFKSAVRNASFERAAGAYEIVSSACAQFAEKKYEDRALIWILNDPSLTEEDALNILALLKENGVRCYLLTLDGADTALAEMIAKESGGLTLACGRPEEIGAAMETLTDLMNNSYTFSYRAEENLLGRHYISISLIDEELEAAADYAREDVS